MFAISGGGKRSSAGKGQGLWQNAPPGTLQTFQGGRNAMLGECRVLVTVDAPPRQLPRPLSPTQLPAPRGHIPFPVAWLHSGWKPPKLGISSLFGHQALLNFVCLGPRGRCVRERWHRGGNCREGCFSLIYSSYYLQQTEVPKNPRPSICHLPPTDKYSSLAHHFFFLAPQPWLWGWGP